MSRRITIAVFCLGIVIGGVVGAMLPAQAAESKPLANQLKGHASPYLALHGADPVAWQQWGPAVLQRAQREGKLIYLSIGYFSCHWCHVMQRESYRDPAIAALLNRNFIPVKIDRELQPALDHRMQQFARATIGIAGWPLNVFLTPEGHPLYALLYAPPQEFKTRMQRLHKRWHDNSARLRGLARGGAMPTQGPGSPVLKPEQVISYAQGFVQQLMQQADHMHGGFGQQTKFPHVPQLQLLLSHVAGAGEQTKLRQFLDLSLKQMAEGGLQDQLGGGFFRYTTDAAWRTPHFEKMLYDNAQLAQLYLRAGVLLKNQSYRAIGERTLGFVLRDMRHPQGAYISALSAVDSAQVEGGYYLWSPAALRRLLTRRQRQLLELAWGWQAVPPFDAGYLPRRYLDSDRVAQQLGLSAKQASRQMRQAHARLLDARHTRQLPRDDKRLAAWNGLLLSALAQAAGWTGQPRYRAAAQALRDYLVRELWDGRQLLRARTGRSGLGQVALEDYAYVAQGLWYWARLTGEEQDYRLCQQVLEQAWERFYGARGWRLQQHSLLAQQAYYDVLEDGAMPSPSAVVADVSLALAQHNNNSVLHRQSLVALNSGAAAVKQQPFWFASHIGAMLRAITTDTE